MKRRLAFFGLVAIPAMALLVATATLVLAVALQDDVDALARRARLQSRAEKNLRADIEAIRQDLAAPPTAPAALQQPSPVAAATGEAIPEGSAHALPARADGPARIVKIGTVAPPECIFKPGDPAALTDCIRRQQDRLAALVPARYR